VKVFHGSESMRDRAADRQSIPADGAHPAAQLNMIARSQGKNRAILVGVLGGLAGTLAMNYAQRAWTRAADGEAPRSAGGKHDARDWQEREEGRNSNELAAQAIAAAIVGRRLTYGELTVAAPLVHYTFGAALGACYGGCVRTERQGVVRRGSAFGATVWLLADEIAMPLLRLSRPTLERALEKHLQSFAAHIVFGIVAEMVRAQTVEGMLRRDRVS
jgi:putative membrane protein